VDEELRIFYYFWKYANLTPSQVYQMKKENNGEYRLLKAFIIQRIEDVVSEKSQQFCPFMNKQE